METVETYRKAELTSQFEKLDVFHIKHMAVLLYYESLCVRCGYFFMYHLALVVAEARPGLPDSVPMSESNNMAHKQMISIIQCSPAASVVLLLMEGHGAVWGKVVVTPSNSSSSGSALWVTSLSVSSSFLSMGSGRRRA